MKKENFLRKLWKQGKISLVDPSEEISLSYLQKADNCLSAAKILLQNLLFENATAEAYYAMYNALLALLFKVGIKSGNHAASISLFGLLFEEKELESSIVSAKEERIDKQYYVETQQLTKVSEENCHALVKSSEVFLLKIKLIKGNLNNEGIDGLREIFSVKIERNPKQGSTGLVQG